MCTFSDHMFNIHYVIYFPEGMAFFWKVLGKFRISIIISKND